MTSPRRTGKKSKARDHHLEEQATAPKKSRANQLPEPCCSSRAGAGSGGKGSQLEKIGAALEVPTQLPKTTTTLPNGSLTNPLAPVPAKKGRKKKSPAQMPPPPYRSEHDEFTMPATQSFYSPFAHGTLPPVYYNSGTHDRFGFNPSLAPPIVPPGTEPNLQALNNPYIAATCSSQSNPPVSSHFSSQSSQKPSQRFPVSAHLWATLSRTAERVEWIAIQGMMAVNQMGAKQKCTSTTTVSLIKDPGSQSHTALPSDHKFEYSHDKDDEATEHLVRDQTMSSLSTTRKMGALAFQTQMLSIQFAQPPGLKSQGTTLMQMNVLVLLEIP
ncbi:hypothetical protein SCLCIDRAFT_27352 [Scleroderma citrinum Foug A]|uniref:Uncharacterized protein n=1 Tax=Scleroderma citrinum Foug A TaxID=1036808 RepID=A0A0C3A3Y3_9AGAM|nr:hypothetical protein SCLCIDRAFT_27352 [Scleroderma citrinum Foug A]